MSKTSTVYVRQKEYPTDFHCARTEFEAEFIGVALVACGGNVSRTASMINLSRRNLQIKIQQYGLDLDAIRSGHGLQQVQLGRKGIEGAISILQSMLQAAQRSRTKLPIESSEAAVLGDAPIKV